MKLRLSDGRAATLWFHHTRYEPEFKAAPHVYRSHASTSVWIQDDKPDFDSRPHGIAYCSELEPFEPATGRRYALLRALDHARRGSLENRAVRGMIIQAYAKAGMLPKHYKLGKRTCAVTDGRLGFIVSRQFSDLRMVRVTRRRRRDDYADVITVRAMGHKPSSVEVSDHARASTGEDLDANAAIKAAVRFGLQPSASI